MRLCSTVMSAGADLSPEGSSGSLTLQQRSPSGTRMTPLLKTPHKPSQMTGKWHSLPMQRQRPASNLAQPHPSPTSPSTPQRPTRYNPSATHDAAPSPSHPPEVTAHSLSGLPSNLAQCIMMKCSESRSGLAGECHGYYTACDVNGEGGDI